MVSAAPPPERFVTQRAECWCQAMPHRLAPSPKGALTVGLKEPTATLQYRQIDIWIILGKIGFEWISAHAEGFLKAVGRKPNSVKSGH